MHFYVAHGAAEAIEDTAALGLVLSKIPQNLRNRPKGTRRRVAGIAGYIGTILHLPEGEARINRDAAFANLALGSESPGLWGDRQLNVT